MKEILRTNDQVLLSYVEMVLKDTGLHPVVFDNHASVLDGSVMAIQRRLLVLDEEEEEASEMLLTIKQEYDADNA